ncbi:lipopolysaccharide assembly protein LapB [Helicobacter sp. MIT 99-5507]|uniref:tetratricopeptide repeat protein n=1 Tax=Helicobacter sp. MIT 99-5507 TaxID=152489 RepID=UPI000E1F4141|nr:tetratricopeptide repeat protein [Helicobacter sp. MIT 99-5507]RDU57935.1 hypothetical protein CQA42_03290 [Helicobacter sp. MIT 99-5507]
MDYFSLIYKDPLFSIMIIIAIITLVAIADYTKNKYKQKTKKQNLIDFAKNFENYGTDEKIRDLLDVSKYPISTLTFIANIYVQNGNFEQAIKMYLTMLDKTQNLGEKIQVLESLGMTYYKAGFMQRAKNIFIEILKNNPRNPKVLLLLVQTYEILGEYKNALSVISCLEELDEKVDKIKKYIQILILINDSLMPLDKREIEILHINKTSKITEKIILNYFKTYNIQRFWEIMLESKNISNYIDILWNIENPPLDLLKNNKQILDIYRAKGIIDDDEKCDIFELESLRVINKYSNKIANLGFKYRCSSCQGVYPFEVFRCPNCSELGKVNLILEIMELNNEKNYSLL